MTRARWAKWFAFASLLELGALVGAILHTPALHALVWLVVFFVVTAALANLEARP
jgi:NADH:ubiquinone oxidoreductase subunit 6 (subunit J)